MALLERSAILDALKRLLERTNSGLQSWEASEDAEDEYWSETPKFSYYVSSRDADSSAPYVFEVWRKVDNSDPIKVGDYTTTSTNIDSLRDANGNLSRLYSAAKASAFGIGGLASDLLDDLS